MKTFSKLLSEVAQPKAEDEINFKEKHVVEKMPHSHAGDEVFKGSTKKAPKRVADYEEGNDEKVYEALDPVGKADADIDNDGDVDSSDKYLHNRRKAIGKAIKKQKKESVELEEKAVSQAQAIAARIALKHKKEGTKPKAGTASAEMMDMSTKDLEDFTKAKKGAPYKVEEETNISKMHDRDLEMRVNTLKRQRNRVSNPKAKDQLRQEIKTLEDEQKRRVSKSLGLGEETNNITEDAWEEIPMMSRQLQFIMYAAEEIMSYLNDCDDMCVDPEEWFQNKLAHVHGQMMTLHGYVEGDRRMNMSMYGEEVELDEVSKDLLGRYAAKAHNRGDMAARMSKSGRNKDMANIANKRYYGVKNAINKLSGRARVNATEETELDEANKNIISDRELNNLVKSKKAVYWRSSGFDKLPNDKFFYIPILDKNKKMLGVYKANANDSDQEYEYLDSMLKDVREEFELGEVTDQERLSARKIQRDAQTARHGIARKPGESMVKYLTRAEKHKKKIKESLEEAVTAGKLKLDDGTSITVSKQDAELINQMFNNLNAKNRKKMQDVMMSDKAGYEEIVGFAREAL